MQKEKDSMSISIATSDLTWADIGNDAKKCGYNLISPYVTNLLEWKHKEIKKKPYYQVLLKLAIVFCVVLIFILLIVRF